MYVASPVAGSTRDSPLSLAGLLLLLPGFFTDIVGFLLLIPALRRILISRFVRVVPGPVPGSPSDHTGAGPQVIEGEYRRERD